VSSHDVGLLRTLLLLPLAPVMIARWGVRTALAEAERQYYDTAAIERELLELEDRLQAGEIETAEFDRREAHLLDRLQNRNRLT
jgi:Gas vesicle protein G